MKSIRMFVKQSESRPGLLSLRGAGSFRQQLVSEGFTDGEEVVVITKEDYDMLLAGSGLGDKK